MLRWLQTVSMPGIEVDKLTHQHLLRSMDALMDHQDAVDDCVAQLLRPLIDEDLSVVFYDCSRRLNSDPPCRSNIDPGRTVAFVTSNCG